MNRDIRIALSGTFNGVLLRLHRVLDLASLAIRPQARLRDGPLVDPTLALVAAAIPAMAVRQGFVRPIARHPIASRTRLDLVGDHGRDLGGVVVVAHTRCARRASACEAAAVHGVLGLEIGEALRFPDAVQLTAHPDDVGVVIHATMMVSTGRGAELVVDGFARLWDADARTTPSRQAGPRPEDQYGT